jgi:hypothetical protein
LLPSGDKCELINFYIFLLFTWRQKKLKILSSVIEGFTWSIFSTTQFFIWNLPQSSSIFKYRQTFILSSFELRSWDRIICFGTDNAKNCIFPKFVTFFLINFYFETPSINTGLILPLGLNPIFKQIQIAVYVKKLLLLVGNSLVFF